MDRGNVTCMAADVRRATVPLYGCATRRRADDDVVSIALLNRVDWSPAWHQARTSRSDLEPPRFLQAQLHRILDCTLTDWNCSRPLVICFVGQPYFPPRQSLLLAPNRLSICPRNVLYSTSRAGCPAQHLTERRSSRPLDPPACLAASTVLSVHIITSPIFHALHHLAPLLCIVTTSSTPSATRQEPNLFPLP